MTTHLSTNPTLETTQSKRCDKPELLLPAGDPEKMRYAIAYGADAVYLGLSMASLRTTQSKDPFTANNLKENIDYCHARGVKAYVTLNIFASNRDLDRMRPHIEMLADSGADAVILSDPGVFRLVQKVAPSLPIHVSTQANTLNVSACEFWHDLGSPRVILAREVPMRDMAEIAEAIPSLELECFVHGSLCVAYSGRCVISDYLTDNTKNSNKGMCGNSCRWEFEVKDKTRPDETYTLVEDEKGSYLLNSKDLCLVRHLGELRDAGIVSFKAEGRTKGIHYVSTIGRVYREAIDTFAQGTPDSFQITRWEDELRDSANRGFTEGFLYGKPGATAYNYEHAESQSTAVFVANATGQRDTQGRVQLKGRNRFEATETLSFMTPSGVITTKALSLSDQNELPVSTIQPNQIVWAQLEANNPMLSLPEDQLPWVLVRTNVH